MPWNLKPKKDVPDCDKPRQAVKKRYSRGFPNGETLASKTCKLCIKNGASYIGIQRELGELKHLSTRRKRKQIPTLCREHSPSSGERKGKSLNPDLKSGGCGANNVAFCFARRTCLERRAVEGNSPVFKSKAKPILYPSTARHEKSCGNPAGPSAKAKYFKLPIVNKYREGKVKSTPVRGVK